jgi:hypothetical protein
VNGFGYFKQKVEGNNCTQRRKEIKFIESERENMKRHSRLKGIMSRKNEGKLARKDAKAQRNKIY